MAQPKPKTFDCQDDLPPLPLPSLEQTMQTYLKSIEPFAQSPEEIEHTTSVVSDFQKGIGPELQALLQDKAEASKNWIEEWWETYAYLQPRYPSAININWHGVVPGNWGSIDMSQAEAAAIFTMATLDYRQALLSGTVPVETLMGQPLCMHQYSRVFTSCVVPGEHVDEIISVDASMQSHILVLRNNMMWRMEVLDPHGSPYSIARLAASFEAIRRDATGLFDMERHMPISVLTSENRSTWYHARHHLQSLDAKNAASLAVIESALFCVTLDEASPLTDGEVASHALLGDGRNRWYDKPFTLIVYENAKSGINGEHAWADAITVVRMFDHCLKYVNTHFKEAVATLRRETSASAPAVDVVCPLKLEWVLDQGATSSIECASAAVSKLIREVELETLLFSHFGNAFCKRCKLTPDFFVQMAIQLAYYKLNTSLPAVYESAHTRLFYHGRTETVRSVSNESLAFCQTFESRHATNDEKYAALQKAIATHGVTLKAALMGQGIDRHLMGLYIASEMSGITPRPSLFTDPLFLLSKRYQITTSNISGGRGASPIWGGFSAMFDDGYGVCYAIQPDRINFSIAAYTSCVSTSAVAFKVSLVKTLLEMSALCVARTPVEDVVASKL